MVITKACTQQICDPNLCTAAEKDAALRALKAELRSATLKVQHSEGLLRLVASDVASVMHASDARGSAPGGNGTKSARQLGLEVGGSMPWWREDWWQWWGLGSGACFVRARAC